jgi:predicted O-methyltransferase YrrM
LNALQITPPFTPELLLEAQHFVEKLRPRRVLEFGAGWSTVWLGELADSVLSFERSIGWYREVVRVAPRNVQLVLTKDAAKVAEYLLGPYDFVYIDNEDEQRILCFKESLRLCKGILMLDDTHWETLRWLGEGLEQVFQCDGMHTRKTGEVQYHHTTAWRVV